MEKLIPAGQAHTRREFRQGVSMRHAGLAELEAALTAGRLRLLALFGGFERALGPDGLRIAFDPVLNPPLWELGHIGWFEEHWLARNPDRARGAGCNPDVGRSPSVLRGADGLYDSANVPHARRWVLDLPTPDETRAYLMQVRASTLKLLRESEPTDDDLYFFRLVLFHEDMHREAWHFMAQQLGIDLGPAMLGREPKPPAPSGANGEWSVPAGMRRLGSPAAGFAFDNELQAGECFVGAYTIDREPVSWQQFLPFIDAGGYETEALWSAAGWEWRSHQHRRQPRHLRQTANGWKRHRFGRWLALDLAAPVLQVSAHEAEACCRWAGRRLPTEAEWETAALRAAEEDEPFEWGEVWEWTASPFAPYAGFVPHPYRDYSCPWFDGRPVLRGASFATAPHMKHPRYRNFFSPDRNDVFAGFRSCALDQRHWPAANDGIPSAV